MPEVQEVRDESFIKGYDFGHYQTLARTGEDEEGYQGEQGELSPQKPPKEDEEDNRISEETDSPEVTAQILNY